MKSRRKNSKGKINNSMAKAKKDSRIDENNNIVKFLKSISQKNYSEANKYLQSVIDSKIKSKIGGSLKEKLF